MSQYGYRRDTGATPSQSFNRDLARVDLPQEADNLDGFGIYAYGIWFQELIDQINLVANLDIWRFSHTTSPNGSPWLFYETRGSLTPLPILILNQGGDVKLGRLSEKHHTTNLAASIGVQLIAMKMMIRKSLNNVSKMSIQMADLPFVTYLSIMAMWVSENLSRDEVLTIQAYLSEHNTSLSELKSLSSQYQH